MWYFLPLVVNTWSLYVLCHLSRTCCHAKLDLVMHYLLLNEFHLVCWMFAITLWFMSLGMSPRRIYLLCNPSGNLRIGWYEECVVFKDLLLALQEDVTFSSGSVSWNIPLFQWHLKNDSSQTAFLLLLLCILWCILPDPMYIQFL